MLHIVALQYHNQMITNDHVAKNTRKDYHLQPKMSFTIVLLVANDNFSFNEHETNGLHMPLTFTIWNMHDIQHQVVNVFFKSTITSTSYKLLTCELIKTWLYNFLICIFGLG